MPVLHVQYERTKATVHISHPPPPRPQPQTNGVDPENHVCGQTQANKQTIAGSLPGCTGGRQLSTYRSVATTEILECNDNHGNISNGQHENVGSKPLMEIFDQ
jgi:hypothetical protein